MRSAAIVVATAVLVLVAFLVYYQWQRERDDFRSALAVHKHFLADIDSAAYEKAYQLMSRRYTECHPYETFLHDVPTYKANGNAEWVCVGYHQDCVKIGEVNSEGWTTGAVYEYVCERDGWRFTGRREYFTD